MVSFKCYFTAKLEPLSLTQHKMVAKERWLQPLKSGQSELRVVITFLPANANLFNEIHKKLAPFVVMV